MLAAARDAGWAVGNYVGVEYVSRVPGPPLDGLIDDLYYLEGTPPYPRLMLPAAPPCEPVARRRTSTKTSVPVDGSRITRSISPPPRPGVR